MTTLTRPTVFSLFRETIAHCRLAWEPLLGGMLIFGILSAGVQYTIMKEYEDRLGTVIMRMGIDAQRLEQIAATGTATPAELIEELAAPAHMLQKMSPEERMAFRWKVQYEVMEDYFAILSLLIVLFVIITLASITFVTIQAATGEEDPKKLAKQTLLYTPKFMCIWSAVIMRTFVCFFFFFGMRYIAAPLIMLKEKKGAWQACTQSYESTNKQTMRLFSFLMWILLIVMSFIWGIHQFYVPLSTGSILGAFFVKAFLQQAVLVLGVVMGVRLGMRYAN